MRRNFKRKAQCGMKYSYRSLMTKMSKIERITISLPAELVSEINAAVKAGEFTTASEAVRDALRHWRRSRAVLAAGDEELRRLVAEGRRSGRPVDGEAALERLRAKYAAMVAGKDR